MTIPGLRLVDTGRPVNQQWAGFYITSMGWELVVLKPRSKEPGFLRWPEFRPVPDDFAADDNIGVKSIRGLVVSDADAPEVQALADAFLANTGAVYGKESTPRAKRLYVCHDIDKTIVFKDLQTGEKILELRAEQDMVPPSTHPNGERLRWHGLLLPPHEIVREMLIRQHRLLATGATVARYYPPAGARHDWCLALAGLLRQLGLTEDEATKVIAEAANYVSDTKLSDRLTEVRSTYAKSEDEPLAGTSALRDLTSKDFVNTIQRFWRVDNPAGAQAVLDEMNERHAVVRVGRDELILREEPDGRIVFQTTGDLSLRYRNRIICVGYKSSGDPILKPLDKFWLDHPKRRSYERVLFAPTNCDPALVYCRPDIDYNLWRGLAVTPDAEPHPERRCPYFLELLQEVICDGNAEHFDFLKKLLAFKIQNPGRVTEVVVFILGTQGTGKGTAVRRGYLPLFRTENWEHVQNPQHILGRFNSLLAEKVAVFIDEGINPKDPQHINAVKVLATEDTITIERKGIDAIKSPNFAQLFIATNGEHAWHTDIDDRRAFILRTSERRTKDTAFFGAVRDELENGGLEALLAVLLATPVTANELRRVPETKAKAEHADRDLDPIDSYYLDALRRGTPLGFTDHFQHVGLEKWNDVDLATTRWFLDWRSSPQGRGKEGNEITERAFAMRMASLMPKEWKTNVSTPENRKANGYRLGSLRAARVHFDVVTKRSRDWDDDLVSQSEV